MNLFHNGKKYCLALILLLLWNFSCHAANAKQLLGRGWYELVRDNDTLALQYFGQAYIEAEKEDNIADKAQALLYMGICQYSNSYTIALTNCYKAMDEFKKLEKAAPAKALEGRSRCLQLLSTIKSRQGQYRAGIALSKEATAGFIAGHDTTGYLGLIYNSLGSAYTKIQMPDSSEYYNRLALQEHLFSHNLAYLPTAYIKVAGIESAHGNKEQSLELYNRALHIADSTANRQAQVSSMLGLGEWQLTFGKNYANTEQHYLHAKEIASTLTDKSFSLRVEEHLLTLYKETERFREALLCQQNIMLLGDSIYSWDRAKEIKNLETQYNVQEKDRQLKLSTFTNYILWAGIALILIVSALTIIILRRINKRDKLLLQTKEALMLATEEQKLMRERQMQQELEFKESQLSAMTLQMLQKNELMQELKEQLDEDRSAATNQSLNKIINKGLNQDKEWDDFNTYFESINSNFYTRLKQAYPDISPNDLKMCALIKLNLSIKETASILNISPDSVKTARYRLRKKLQLNTEDNLAEFIMGL